MLEHEADLTLAHVGVGGVLAMEEDVARIGHLQAGDDAEQRRLARARRPEQRHQLAGRDVEVEVVADDRRAEALVEVADFDAHYVFSIGAAASPCAWTRRSTMYFSTSVTRASPASSEATAKAAANWYSL